MPKVANDSANDLIPACLALVGRIGSGKTTLSVYLSAKIGWPALSLSAFLSSRLDQEGEPQSRKALQDLGMSWIRSDALGFCRAALTFAQWQPHEGLIIDGIRDIILFDGFRTLMNPMPALLIFLDIDEEKRRDRLSRVRSLGTEQVLHDELHPIEQGVEALKRNADLVLDGTRPPAELYAKITKKLSAH